MDESKTQFCDRDIEDVLLIRHSGERRKIAPPTPPHSLSSVCRHTALREGRGRGATVLFWLFSLRTRSTREHYGSSP